MGYRVMVNGVAIEADSMDEALALAARLRPSSGKSGGRANAQHADVSAAESARWDEFLEAITQNQRRALKFIKAESGLSMIELSAKMGFNKTNQATGVVGGGLRKNLEKFGLDHDEVLKTKTVDGESRYYAGRLLEAKDL